MGSLRLFEGYCEKFDKMNISQFSGNGYKKKLSKPSIEPQKSHK